MKLINDNLQKTGIFNSLLIVIALVLRLINIGKLPFIGVVEVIANIIALLFGLLYSLNGYKKDVANYYKTFMCLYALGSAFSFVLPLLRFGFNPTDQGNIIHIIHLVVLVCICLLAFVKDFGEHNSKATALILLVMNAIILANDLLSGAITEVYFVSLSIFVQSIIAYILVSHKYSDKKSRGTE